jgi:hypothetical protein
VIFIALQNVGVISVITCTKKNLNACDFMIMHPSEESLWLLVLYLPLEQRGFSGSIYAIRTGQTTG